MMPLFAFLFFIMLASGAKAADYLWEPKLLWESKESYSTGIGGLRFINDDKEVLYSAEQTIFIRDAETGEILRQSEKSDRTYYSGIRLSKDKKVLYSYASTPNNPTGFRGLVRFDYSTLKQIDSIHINSTVGILDYNGVELDVHNLQEIIPISDTKVYLLFQAVREPNPNEKIYGYCLISFNPQKKDFSWDNKEDWKMEYYFVSKDNSSSNRLIITQDNKYLIGETPTNVKILDLETLKDYWSISGENISAITPNAQFILSIHNPGNLKIFNIADKSEMFSLDSKALLESSSYKADVSYETNDPFKIFYGGSGDPYYDCTDKKDKYTFDPKLNMAILNCNEKATKFLAGYYEDPSNSIYMYSTNPTAGIGDHGSDDKPEYLTISNNKLIIPINEIAPKEITIFNADGKLIKQFYTFDADKENIYLNVSFLNQGVYFVSVISENGNRTNYKFLKGE